MLIRELIDLPEQVHRGDFVLRLTEGVTNPEATLETYVVTPQLVSCFEDALAFIRGAVEARSSKAAYLHGSFGSGKSHFMAVLHLLLQENARARSIRELAPVVAKHARWIEGKRFLLVPYHMIGARSMESAILGHYAEHVLKLHPEARVPGVYLAEGIFENARNLRAQMGDETFFEALNAGSGGGGEWGELEKGWDAERLESAMRAPARSEERVRLVGDLVQRLLTAYQEVAATHEESFVPLDDGLSIISKHAKELGYDAVVLFLDELILWLASHAADPAFVSREGQKLAKLVESQEAERPIPLVSFVARQRDLRELVGEHVTGAEQLSFADVLQWWEARFHKITLEDRNLAAIAERRVLKPKSEAARQRLDQAFEDTAKVREEVMNTLLTSTADREMFRKVYPFSPALVQTLVGVSSALQRERTALKVMLQLLVNQRERLRLGDLVPVGDLFDVISEGDEPFNDLMRSRFEQAKRLYHQKLLPMLEKDHGVRAEDVKGLSDADPKAKGFRGDDRLVKTLLLAALVPEVEALKELTAGRLAALNHGTIRSPIPGQEGSMVLARLRKWAAEVGEIRIGEEPTNPTISIQLLGVDTQSILEKAKSQDNTGNRRRKIRELLFQELGVVDRDELFLEHSFDWRGTKRGCEILFGNVRELPDTSLQARGDEWKVVIDFPFDEPGYTPNDDLARLGEFRQTNETTSTLVWIPAFFTLQAQADLGKLVILDHVLTGERFSDYASHLSLQDRVSAKSLLENQQSQLRARVRSYLEGAYGIAEPQPGAIDTSHELSDHVQALAKGFPPRPPTGANLRGGFLNLLDQALSHQSPAHPHLGGSPADPKDVCTRTNLRKVLAELQRATQTPDGRIPVDKPLRDLMRRIAQPLELGEMGETHFVLGHRWRTHFLKKHAAEGGGLTVEQLRAWTDDARPMGLTRDIQSLVILAFAEQANYSFWRHGGPYEPSLEQLPDELELRPVALPPAEQWEVARERAGAVLGLTVSKLINASNVEKLGADARAEVAKVRAACNDYRQKLRERLAAWEIRPEDAARARTADAVVGFVETVSGAGEEKVVGAIAGAVVATSEAAMGTSLRKAPELYGVLEGTNWEVFDALRKLADERREPAQGILKRVADALAADEYAVALAPVLRDAQSKGLRLLTDTKKDEIKSPPGSRRVIEEAVRESLDAGAARSLFRDLESKLEGGRSRKLNLRWILYGDEE